MEPEGSLPYSQVPATSPYRVPARSSPYPQILLPEDPSSCPSFVAEVTPQYQFRFETFFSTVSQHDAFLR